EWFFLACGNQTFWVKLCNALGLPLADDPRFASWMLRLDNRESLLPLLEQKFASQPRAHWLRLLAEHDIPAAPVQGLMEFMDDPAVRHHGMTRTYAHPDVDRLRLLGQPLVFSDTAAPDPGPPPALGQHTDEVLHELGYESSALADLRARKVIR
ncbi:MAG: CoA transferase, partial [Candidatus Rokuibacteriota bacterium]